MTDRPRLCVLGTGYLGATHAVCMAELGFDVVGMDVDEAKVASLADGTVPFFEPGLPELLTKNLESGRLRFTTSYEEAGAFGDVHFVCVGTPQKKGEYAADMSYVDAVVGGIAPYLRDGALVVGKSTVPAGTAARLATELARTAPQAELAWNPEFLREGFAVEDTLTPDRLVFGVESQRAEDVLRTAYAPVIAVPTPVVVTDFATAELVKVSANAFLATKISFINAMAEVCEATGGDVTKLSEALSYDDRIGGRFLHAGLEVDAINLRRRARMVDLACEELDDAVQGARIAVLGAAFKPNSDDIRDSPALDVAAALQSQGATVTVYDPAAMPNAKVRYPELGFADSAVAAATGADLVLHLTEWQEFRQMDPAVLSAVVAQRRILDGRNALDPAAWRAAGWTYRALGRP